MIEINKGNELEILVPISIDLDWPSVDQTVESIVEQHEKFGLKRFSLACPGGGWRSVHYPSENDFVRFANTFNQIKERLKDKEIVLGWWDTLTIKSGSSPLFQPIVKSNGENHPFANCPLCENFKEQFAKNVAQFCKIANPAYVIFEDDYSVNAAAGGLGCFCQNHLNEFAKREGKKYTREELLEIFAKRDSESLNLLRRYQKLTKDSLVALSARIREEVDKYTPDISIGLSQPGGSDADGDTTLEICRALAGKNKPFCRFFGAFYNGGDIKDIPTELYHAIYGVQHINEDFGFYHESDTFPHTRFFSSAKMMKAFISIAYSQGFTGSVFQTQQLLDDPNEEKVYGIMLKSERARYNEIIKTVAGCKPVGVEVNYDPFYNTIERNNRPQWVKPLAAFGIPYKTTQSNTAFLDETTVKYATDEELKKYLSGNLFLDGEAAYILCKRGYGEFIGTDVGENVTTEKISYDLAAREVIKPPFDIFSKGKNMPSAHMFSNCKNGILRKLTPISNKTEIISEAYTYTNEKYAVAMTRYENELGGKVVVMGLTLKRNNSQALYNYRRMHILNNMLLWMNAEIPFVKDEPYLHIIVNKANKEKDFSYQITIVNLGDDMVENIEVYLPKEMREREIKYLTQEGKWQQAAITKTENGIIINQKIDFCDAIYLKLL